MKTFHFILFPQTCFLYCLWSDFSFVNLLIPNTCNKEISHIETSFQSLSKLKPRKNETKNMKINIPNQTKKHRLIELPNSDSTNQYFFNIK